MHFCKAPPRIITAKYVITFSYSKVFFKADFTLHSAITTAIRHSLFDI